MRRLPRPLLALTVAALACAGCRRRRADAAVDAAGVTERPARPAKADELRPPLETDMRQIAALMAGEVVDFARLVEPAHRLYRTSDRLVWMSEVELGKDARFSRDARMVRTNAARLWEAAKTRKIEKARDSWRKFEISFGYCYPTPGGRPTP